MAAAEYYHHPELPADGSHIPLNPDGGEEGKLAPVNIEQLKTLQREDERLKQQIRHLRLIARVVAFLLSIAVFVPITLTVAKFLATRDVFREVRTANGTVVRRTAWAKNSVTWPTYMYFGIAFVSLVLNAIIMIAYLKDVRSANKAARLATVFTWLVLITNVVVWAVGAALYKYGKDANAQKDLWGWTCSKAARELQKAFEKEVQFIQYCDIQGASWIAGLVQVGVAALTAFIYYLAMRRRNSKKNIRRMSSRLMSHY